MTQGGARNRSGPPADPRSLRSAQRGLALTTLPNEPYAGDVPDFPLPSETDRETDLWAQVWTYPQAHAWAVESWRWQTIAMWVRLSVRCEDPEAGAALMAQLHRFADQIGMTKAGQVENGWAIAVDQVAAKRAQAEQPAAAPRRPSARDRFAVVQGGQGVDTSA